MRSRLLTRGILVIMIVFVLGIGADLCLIQVVPQDFDHTANNITFVTTTLDDALDQLEMGMPALVQIMEGEYEIIGRSLVLSDGSIIEGKSQH